MLKAKCTVKSIFVVKLNSGLPCDSDTIGCEKAKTPRVSETWLLNLKELCNQLPIVLNRAAILTIN